MTHAFLLSLSAIVRHNAVYVAGCQWFVLQGVHKQIVVYANSVHVLLLTYYRVSYCTGE
jgi:hypothetical protein